MALINKNKKILISFLAVLTSCVLIFVGLTGSIYAENKSYDKIPDGVKSALFGTFPQIAGIETNTKSGVSRYSAENYSIDSYYRIYGKNKELGENYKAVTNFNDFISDEPGSGWLFVINNLDDGATSIATVHLYEGEYMMTEYIRDVRLADLSVLRSDNVRLFQNITTWYLVDENGDAIYFLDPVADSEGRSIKLSATKLISNEEMCKDFTYRYDYYRENYGETIKRND